jgi:putative aldouronate transport system permease protein
MPRFKLTAEDIVLNVFCSLIGLFVIVATLYPILYMLVYSLNDPLDASKGGLFLFPRIFTLQNYGVVLSDARLLQALVITVVRTVIGTIGTVLVTAMVAYALSRDRLIFRRGYSLVAIITMYFNGGIIPFYLVLQNFGLLNSFWVYIIPQLFGVFNALLFMAFFRQMPRELEEAAKLDGANDFQIFWRIALPIAKPVVATVALFVAVSHWNDWFTSAYFVANQNLWTLPTIIIRLLSSVEAIDKMSSLPATARVDPMATLTSIKYATLIISILPITVLYPFVQRYFVKGMMVGSIKG